MAATDTPQAHLLSSEKLRINDRLLRGQPEPDTVILRAAGGHRRLVVSPTQADLLTEGFSGYKTVPEVLVRAIAESRCPPLREFYELVVQAHAANILLATPPPAETPRVLRWPARLPARFALFVAGGIAVASVAVLAAAIPRWHGPANWVDVAASWAAACALLSLGQLLAACAIAASGEVRAARLFWQTRFPHFRIDATEAIMGGRACERAAAALRAAPILAGAAIAAWQGSGWLPGLGAAALYVLAPFGHSAARQWLASHRRVPPYSIRTDVLFEPMRDDLWARWMARLRGFKAEFGWLGVAWTTLWAAALVLFFTRCMPQTATAVSSWVLGVSRPVHLGAEYLLLGVIVLGSLVGAWAGVRHWWLERAWARPLRGADARVRDRPPLTGDGAAMLGQVPLFRGIDEESRAVLAEAMTPVTCAPGETVVREDEAGEDFYVVADGELEVRKRLPQKSRSVTIGWLGPGECFGEIALLENTARTATVVASRETRLLRLGRAEFQRLVVERVGPASIRELLQHARFLGRFTFTAGWSFAELVKFAQRCRTVRVDADTALVSKGEHNPWFYLIFDGAFEAREGKRVLRRMGPGDYFGEISLLEGWPATADVVAIEESRCLTLSRTDFLELFARDFRIGLRIEALARQRLGSRVFVSR